LTPSSFPMAAECNYDKIIDLIFATVESVSEILVCP